MDFSLLLIIITLSCLHIFSGPNHYLPFIALSKSRDWNFSKTMVWTIICSLGHIGGSVIISFIVIALGWGASKTKWLEGIRGDITGWLLLSLGLIYAIYSIIYFKKNKAHKHFDVSNSGNIYVYEHKHGYSSSYTQKNIVTPWVMFLLFTLAPNEPMIPLLSVLGINHNVWSVILFVLIYIITTIAATIIMVLLGYYGFSFFKTDKLEKYLHVISGVILVICGAGMVLFHW